MSEALPLHRGACHCGRIRFEVEARLDHVVECNCSICHLRGALWHGVRDDRLRILAGADELSLYQFGTHTARHWFCRHCGVAPFARPRLAPEHWVANVCCLAEVDVRTLPVVPFDGRHWEAAARDFLARGAEGDQHPPADAGARPARGRRAPAASISCADRSRRSRAMHCPKCHSPFEQVKTADGVVDRCTGCRGLWFDILEHEELKRHAAAIDTGDAAAGAQHNANDRIACPRCANSRMLRMVDAGQPHIWFESCPVCHGRFYDAGEFRDFAEFTVADFLKGLRSRARD